MLPAVRPIVPAPGGQLAPDEVFGRDGDIARAWDRLERSSIRLTEPRRIGKTSFLVRLAHAPPDGWFCVRQSFQGVATREAMAARALSGIYSLQPLGRRVGGRLKQFLNMGSVSASVDQVTFELRASFRDDPAGALDQALQAVDDALGEQRLVLVWDEVPDMVLEVIAREGVDAASELLAVLRRFRDERRPSSLRWLMTGSVGFHHSLRSCTGGDALIADLEAFSIGPLDQGWARWLCDGLLLGAGVTADPDVASEMAEVTAGIPYLAHLVAQYARDRGWKECAAGEVQGWFDLAAADLDHSQAATHLLSRLGRYYGDDAATAEWVLDQTVMAPMSRAELEAAPGAHLAASDDAALRQVLDWLCLDHYLEKHPQSGRYSWRYPALGRIWKIRRA